MDLLTQHEKERVIAPVLEPGLGCSIELVTGFDTDQYGTFTRETPRNGTRLEAASRRQEKACSLRVLRRESLVKAASVLIPIRACLLDSGYRTRSAAISRGSLPLALTVQQFDST